MTREPTLRRRLAGPNLFPRMSILGTLPSRAESLQHRLRHLLDEPWEERSAVESSLWEPVVDVSETPTEFVVKAELPGLMMKDVTVEFSDGALLLHGEKVEKRVEDTKYFVWERTFGSFRRVIPFAAEIEVERITAEFTNGVLSVRLPKTEQAKAQHRTIPILPR